MVIMNELLGVDLLKLARAVSAFEFCFSPVIQQCHWDIKISTSNINMGWVHDRVYKFKGKQKSSLFS